MDRKGALFALHPTEFIAARNALAAELKKEGDAEGAAEVKALPKPSLALWAVNQAARTAKRDVAELIDVSAELRQAQLDMARGKASDFRALSDRHRDVVRKVRQDLAKALGIAPTERSANLDRAEATLLAAASGDGTQREALREGMLQQELSAAGFDIFGGVSFPAAPKPPKPLKAPAKAGKPDQKAEAQALREAKAAERSAKEKANALAAAAHDAKAAADAAEREHAAAKAAKAKAEAARDEAKEALRKAQQALDEAEAEARRKAQEEKKAATAAAAAKRRAAAAEANR